jgi:hypothetical protein
MRMWSAVQSEWLCSASIAGLAPRMSADTSAAARQAVADAQCRFVAKPVECAVLHEALAELLDRRSPAPVL